MKQHSLKSPTGQLWVVIGLLAVSVILPTVCLLWFMTQAVRNERLAIRQKLTVFAEKEVGRFQDALDANWRRFHVDFQRSLRILEHSPPLAVMQNAVGAVVYDANGQLIYPNLSLPDSSGVYDELSAAFSLERSGKYMEAAQAYESFSDADKPGDIMFAAYMGRIRSLEKAGQVLGAYDLFTPLLAVYDGSVRDKLTPYQVAMVRVRRIKFLADHHDTIISGAMFSGLYSWYNPNENYSAYTTIWALSEMLEIAERFRLKYDLAYQIAMARKIIDVERTSVFAAEGVSLSDIQSLPTMKFVALERNRDLYMTRYKVDDKTVLIIRSKGFLRSMIESEIASLDFAGFEVVVLDGAGNAVYGSGRETRPVVEIAFCKYFPGWVMRCYFDGDDIFATAANRQAAVYMWAGILVAALIVMAGILAALAVARQIRLNRLKNNFIATVSHELKTPLASMRVLVDTLVEGNYEGEETVGEYLRLISSENLRLSRLIDNFLSFSRMERGKEAFELRPVEPGTIARGACEAVKTKFCEKNCEFIVTIADDLPSVMADADAMVTVLVNLLDNAWKYSYDGKRVELRVFAEGRYVCFSVKDNGIGMSRLQVKRVFERFYQADSSLSRRAEGAGLGLSIVKFIVDAHDGKIEVNSTPEKGSEFVVRIAES